jgi:hypothetical protein
MTYFLQECECGANFYLVDVAIKQFDDAYTFYLCEHNVGPKARSKTNATNPFSINTRPFACWACTPRIEAEIAFGQMGRGGLRIHLSNIVEDLKVSRDDGCR